MRRKLVKTSNVERFLAAERSLGTRGAREACFVLVSGDAGHGKTFCGMRWGQQHGAVRIVFKAGATRHWLLRDLVTELGQPAPGRSCEELFRQAVERMAEGPRPIVLDEIEHALDRGAECLDAIRDLSDMFETPVILIGRPWVKAALRQERRRQIWTRIAAIAEFLPLTIDDIGLLRRELVECEADPEVDGIVLAQSGGLIREAMNGLAEIERIGRSMKERVTAAALGDRVLVRHRAQSIASLAAVEAAAS